jgi:hypothetical protein
MNITELLKLENNSITDYETIQYIGSLCYTVNDVSKVNRHLLYKKVNRDYQYVGLYPNVMKIFNVLPDKLK